MRFAHRGSFSSGSPKHHRPRPLFPVMCALLGVMVGSFLTRITMGRGSQVIYDPTPPGGRRLASTRDKMFQVLNEPVARTNQAAPPKTPTPAAAQAGAPAGAPALAAAPAAVKNTPPAEPHRRAYAFYAAEDHYWCSALVNIRRLRDTGADPSVPAVIIVPDAFPITPARLAAAEKVGARVHTVPRLGGGVTGYYHDCMTKLYIFNMTEFDRVIYMDSDSLVLHNMDDLFGLPEADMSAPRAYWLNPGRLKDGCGGEGWAKANGPEVGMQMKFTSAVMIVQPSARVWERITSKYFSGGGEKLPAGWFDMDLLNVEFKDEVALLRGETVLALSGHWAAAGTDQVDSAFKGRISQEELWNQTRVVHFSPNKPWTGAAAIRSIRPGAHPRFYEAFEVWEKVAKEVCA